MYEVKVCGPCCAGNDVGNHPGVIRPNQTQPQTRPPPAHPASPGGRKIRKDRFSDGLPATETIGSGIGSDEWRERPNVSLFLKPLKLAAGWLHASDGHRVHQPAGIFYVGEYRVVPKMSSCDIDKSSLRQFMLKRLKVPHPKMRLLPSHDLRNARRFLPLDSIPRAVALMNVWAAVESPESRYCRARISRSGTTKRNRPPGASNL